MRMRTYWNIARSIKLIGATKILSAYSTSNDVRHGKKIVA